MHEGLPPLESAGVLLHKDSSDSLVESTVSSGHCPNTGVRWMCVIGTSFNAEVPGLAVE